LLPLENDTERPRCRILYHRSGSVRNDDVSDLIVEDRDPNRRGDDRAFDTVGERVQRRLLPTDTDDADDPAIRVQWPPRPRSFTPGNARFSPSIGQFNLDFVEREETPYQLMKLSIQLYLTELYLSNTVKILERFSVEQARSPFITGFIRLIYSPIPAEVRITSRLTRRWSDSGMNSTSCMLLLIQVRTNCTIKRLSRL